MIWTRARSMRAGLGAAAVVTILFVVAAAHDQPDVVVLTLDQPAVRQSGRGGGMAPAAQTGSEPTCNTPQPIGTWSCQNGVWVAGIAPASGPNGTGPGNCITPSPGAGWSCQNGIWVSAASEAAAGRGTANITTNTGTANPAEPSSGTPSTTTGSTTPCPPPAPSPGWTCQNGTWTAPGAGSPATTLPSSAPASPPVSCPGPPPSATASCQNGVWVIR